MPPDASEGSDPRRGTYALSRVDHTPESLTIRPAPRTWRSLIRRNSSADALLIRRELGLSTDRPIIMTGHQAEFWHPGILAKYLATDAAASALRAQPAHLVVDQDRAETVPLHYPARSNGSLSIGTATVRERTPPPTPRDPAPPVTSQLAHLLTTFARHQASPTLAHQVSSTVSDLLQPFLSLQAPTLFATQLSHTSLFQSLVSKMSRNPESCITAYNAAAARRPTSGIRPLTASDIQDRWELPLWHLPPGRPRTHVFAENLATIPPHELAPKALFMTALLRLAACDLFIHGTGGGGGTDDDSHEGYDLVMEDWLESWLDIPRSQLAPMAVVTATRYLPLSSDAIPTAADLAHARWLAHHARHDPAMLGNVTAATAKQLLLDQISLLPRHSRARADAFRQLHSILDASRRAHAAALAALDANAGRAAARFAERDILFNRAWPFPLFPDSILTSLRDEIAAAFRIR